MPKCLISHAKNTETDWMFSAQLSESVSGCPESDRRSFGDS